MVDFEGLQASATAIAGEVTEFVNENIGVIGAGAAGLAIGGAVGAITSATVTSKKRRKRKSSKSKTKRRRTYKRKRHTRTRKTPHTAGKRRDTSHRRIRQTKNGQPYVILANGRARFISKKSAKASRRRKGGRY